MTTLQKIIKYLALAFAITIIVNIISAILIGVFSLGIALDLVQGDTSETISGETITTNIDNIENATMNISLQYSSLEIKKGESLLVETNSNNVSCKQDGNKITIEEKKHNSFFKNEQSKVIIYVPEDMKFEKARIETGAGEISAEKINADELKLEIGAGKVEIQELNVNDEAKIDGGAGRVDILAGQINNMDLDMGVGKFSITTKLNGKNTIDQGIGELNIDLTDELENYTIKAENGIGEIKLNNKKMEEDTSYGDGLTKIKVNGGIGSVNISTK